MEKSFDQTYKLFLILFAVQIVFSGYLFFRLKTLEKKGIAGGVQAAAPAAGTGAAAAPAGPEPTTDTSAMPAISDTDHIRGNKDADIVMVEYSDYECPFCKNFHPTTQQILNDYGDKVALVYRHYPLSFHQNAQKEAEAAECIAELGGEDAFWRYTDTIFERTASNGTGFALDKLQPLAEELGVDGTSFQNCLDSGKYAQKVKGEEAGGAKAGISGTPGTILVAKNGKRDFVSGAYPVESVKAQIDALLK
jgi:protein-disulfide isomerase